MGGMGGWFVMHGLEVERNGCMGGCRSDDAWMSEELNVDG